MRAAQNEGNNMKQLIAAIFLSLVACVAFALPKPSQIEDALAARHYAEARSMVAEVLREKPDSARAHLMNAYLLAHVDHNKQAANAELQSASELDKRGDVKSSPLFGRVVAEIDMLPVPRATVAQIPGLPRQKSRADEVLVWAVVVACFALLAGWLIVCLATRPRKTVYLSSGGSSFGGYGHSRPAPPPAPPAPSPSYSTGQAFATTINQANPAMGAFGMAASVAGGVVAGNVISDMMHHRQRDDDDERERRRRESSYADTSPAYSDPSPIPTETERSSFSSSSSGSDSWSSGDSSWSSSDSSSSSSDWGSSDSGSSSGDW